jgi:peptide chain release factor subunit 1
MKQVEMALNMGAVHMLLISEGLEKMKSIEEGTVVRLAELAENSKADVAIISTESEDGVSLQKAFGGVAAILRYPIN